MPNSRMPDNELLAFWHTLEEDSVLQCPSCHGHIKIAEQAFACHSCSSIYPIENGVPFLMKPNEVVSIPDRVMEVFNLPSAFKDRVEAALKPLIKYRTHSHPEFANFFARFDASDMQPQTRPLSSEELAAAVERVDCVTSLFPHTIHSDDGEFRSIRIRNQSDQVLFTDKRNPLYLSYRLFTLEGKPIAFEGERSPLPCALRPGGELTVPVKVRLPAGLLEETIVRFYFLLAKQPKEPLVTHSHRRLRRGWISAGRDILRLSHNNVIPSEKNNHSSDSEVWFDKLPLAEMTVIATQQDYFFPASRRGELHEFDVQSDVSRAEEFISSALSDLRAKGISKPRILEIGAGVYPISLRTCGEGSMVVVSDISLVMQTLASVMHTNNPAVLEARAGFASFDMMYPPFRDGTFDIICICAAFHHIPYPVEFLRRLSLLLSTNGRFVAVREPCIVNPMEPTYLSELSNGFNEQMFELSEWQTIIAGGGLTIDSAVIDFGCSLKFSACRPPTGGS